MRHDLHFQAGQQRIQRLPFRTVAKPPRHHHPRFLQADRRHQPGSRRQDRVNEAIFLRLIPQDRDDRRGIDDNGGQIPFSS